MMKDAGVWFLIACWRLRFAVTKKVRTDMRDMLGIAVMIRWRRMCLVLGDVDMSSNNNARQSSRLSSEVQPEAPAEKALKWC